MERLDGIWYRKDFKEIVALIKATDYYSVSSERSLIPSVKLCSNNIEFIRANYTKIAIDQITQWSE